MKDYFCFHLFIFNPNDMNLDLSIVDTNSPKTMAIVDLSSYDTTPTSPNIIITIPGFNSVTVSFQPRKVNVINSNILGLSSVTDYTDLTDIPDGIYKISYTVLSQTITRSFIRVEKLRCTYENAILSSESVDMKKLIEIEFMIQSAIASANICNYDLAVELYKQAAKELYRLTD